MKGFNSLFSQSSLVPLAKIANAPSRSLRLLWAVFTATMFVGLCSCITLVVIQYCRHQTVFQLDYSGRNVLYDQVPGFTLCPQIQEAKRLFNEAMDVEPKMKDSLAWLDKANLDAFRNRARMLTPNLTTGAIVHRLPPGQLYWDTRSVSLSPLYGILQNISVRFHLQPSRMELSHRLTVMEQVRIFFKWSRAEINLKSMVNLFGFSIQGKCCRIAFFIFRLSISKREDSL
ncbi:unnamed protein product [Echinostoma caproni]|uniref:Uncharacterized protein n=1 Tax=Echinostoma caproni TaxID=27848 RepID=A0A183AGE0_9TREM|nr:unnamed protein product [Echinostoma caproni]